ncbi:MAG: RluA family pseudouridine synthase [Oscillospiraceae bacterium]
MRSFTAKINDEGVRLNRFCEKVCPSMPQSLLHKAFRNKRIKVNGKKQEENYRLQLGDMLELYINDEFFSCDKKDEFLSAPHENLDIIYEDNNVILLFKPFGLLCHSDNKSENNLVDMVKSYLFAKNEYLPDNENTFTPSLCNRIDQGTQGIVIAAKNYHALSAMNEIIRDNMVQKQYLCVCEKGLADGVYTAYLDRDLNTKKVSVSSLPAPNSKEIITEFKTLSKKSNFSLIECTLITGRTHQIRAHLSFLGCPILGDTKYGKPFKGLKSQVLSAYKLTFKSLPTNSILSYLSNKTFQLEHCFPREFFDKL